MRPKYLDHCAAALAVFLAAQLPFVGSGALPVGFATIVVAPFLALFAIVFWFFWHGHNWARVSTIVYSLLAITGLEYLPRQSTPQQIVTLADAAFSTVLIYWLFRPSVRAYFTRSQVV